MLLFINKHKYHYEMENLCRVFFPDEQIRVLYEKINIPENELTVVTTLERKRDSTKVTALINEKSDCFTAKRTVHNNHIDYDAECEFQMADALFEILCAFTSYIPKWGLLTGVRPAKLMLSLIAQYGEKEAYEYFCKRLSVSPDKTMLALNVAKAEQDILALSKPNSFSLYVSIPFCPTRCSYCSFVSHSIEHAKKLLPGYLEYLNKEIEITAKIASDLGLRLETVYIGGGTPTTLSAEQLRNLNLAIEKNFNISTVREYTIESGRPDTITVDRLKAMQDSAVTRISINPQTFNESSLKAIGRMHSAQCSSDAFHLARKHGFHNINMDLIAGLPMDDLVSFENTLDTTLSLNPESITLHTLALKRSSKIVTEGLKVLDAELVPQMLNMAQKKFLKYDYAPYYMYRQSRCLGNLENVGWCKEGFKSLYNVYMMEEGHTILAVGAGAVTKLKEPNGSYIERIFNFKYPYEYINRFEELMQRKGHIKEFYSTYK